MEPRSSRRLGGLSFAALAERLNAEGVRDLDD
jgi:hypothetical protein